ncbi:MAG: CheR family methyltransferase [Polyangiaceae bacterium]
MALAREVLSGIEERLHEHAGLDLPAWVVEARALARMGALRLSATAYLELVNSPGGAGELLALVEAVRVGETSFFRHRPQVDALLDVVVPSLRERDCRSPRVWSAGCATGEEPYTLALILGRALPRPTFSPSILATDVSAEAIATAERACYPASEMSDVPPAYRDGFTPEGDSVRVRPEVASLVRFRLQNLADPDAPRGFDLVWCRNVLIYFGPEAKRRVLDRLVAALVPGGYLFLGYSETLRHVAGLQAVHYGDQVLWQKPLVAVAGRGEEAISSKSVRSPLREAVSKARRDVTPRPSMPASAEGIASAKVPVSRTVERAPAPREMVLAVTDPEARGLSAELRAALATPGVAAIVIDLDGAEILEDAAATALRRAFAAAEPRGVTVTLRATRPGTTRWLRRNGLADLELRSLPPPGNRRPGGES